MARQYAFESSWDHPVPGVKKEKLSGAAKKNRNFKTTDSEPITIIVNKANGMEHIDAVDLGCGIGRYDMLLYRYLGDKLALTCLDADGDMIRNLTTYFSRHGVNTFSARKSAEETLPFISNSMDFMFAFSTIQQYSLPRILSESARVIKNGGYLFVYTGVNQPEEKDAREQRPGLYQEKDKLPFTMETLKQTLDGVDSLLIESIVFFAYNRIAAVEQLFLRNKSHRYSTFTPYTPESMEEALKPFSITIKSESEDLQSIRWFDDKVLFVIKKEQKTSVDYLQIANSFNSPGIMA